MATIGSPAINRAGAYGNVETYYRALIELANPASGSGYVISVSAYFAVVRAGQTGYIVIMTDEGGGVFSSRSYQEVTFPSATGLKTWGAALAFQDGDYIGIVLPIAGTTADIGIDVDASGGSGVRHIQTLTGMPIVSETFAIFASNIMSLQGTTGTPESPVVTTQAVTDISGTTAIGNGNITNLGTPTATQYGACWNTTGTPTTSDDKTEEGVPGSTGAFTTTLTSLVEGTKYYMRAYVTNAYSTAYGSEVTFYGAGTIIFPTEAITRVTNLIHRYNRKEGVYTLEMHLGEVTSDFGLPEWLSRPIASIPETDKRRDAKEFADSAEIKESVQEAVDEAMRRERGVGAPPGMTGVQPVPLPTLEPESLQDITISAIGQEEFEAAREGMIDPTRPRRPPRRITYREWVRSGRPGPYREWLKRIYG